MAFFIYTQNCAISPGPSLRLPTALVPALHPDLTRAPPSILRGSPPIDPWPASIYGPPTMSDLPSTAYGFPPAPMAF